MNKHWLHPLNILVFFMVAITIMIWSINAFFGIGDAMEKLSKYPSSLGPIVGNWSWAHMISAAIWVIGFSAGAVGCLVNLSNAIRLHGAKAKDFSPIKDLTKDEIEDLNLWLDSNTYGSEHLKELWGEKQ